MQEEEAGVWIDPSGSPIAKWKPAYLAARSSNRHKEHQKSHNKPYAKSANDRSAADRERDRTGISAAPIPFPQLP